MRKKELAALPVMKTKSKKRVFGVRVDGDTLVLDGWDEGEYKGRYCLRDNGEYMTLVDGTWQQQKLADMLNGQKHHYWYWHIGNGTAFTEEQEKLAAAFIDKSGLEEYACYTNIEERINQAEKRALTSKREQAKQRKLDRIQQRMSAVPSLPDGFKDWCRAVPFAGKQYLFKGKRENEYICTACGKTHRLKTAKQNRMITCSRTGAQVKVDKRRTVRTETHHTMVLQWMTTGERVARHFNLESIWTPKGQTIFAYEQVRYVLQKAGCNEYYYGVYGLADEREQEWDEHNPKSFHCYREFCYPEGVREVLAGTVYEHLGIPEMAAAGWKVWYNKIMFRHNYAGVFEYLAKGRYRRLAEEMSDYYGYSEYRGATLREALGVDKQRANRLRQANGGILYLAWLREEQKTGRKISEKTMRQMEEYGIAPNRIRFILDRMSPEQVANYLARQKEQSRKSISFLLNEWNDMLRMAGQLKMNTADDIAYRPRDLIVAHDRLVQRINEQAAAKQERDYEKRFPGLGKVCRSLGKYEWSDGEYTVLAPKKILDILAEGRSLNHCVTNERYFERMARAESYILFLRRANAPDVPWYTLEVEPGGVIRQKRTHWNRQEKDLQPAMNFLCRWQKEIRKRLNAKDNNLQERAAAARKQEFEQLRRDGVIVHGGELAGTLLADVLLADLMEIPA